MRPVSTGSYIAAAGSSPPQRPLPEGVQVLRNTSSSGRYAQQLGEVRSVSGRQLASVTAGSASAIADANQPVMVLGWVMAVPTTTVHAPARSACAAWAGVWIRPSATTGTSIAAASRATRSRSGPGCLLVYAV